MEIQDWETDKKRLLIALGKLDGWTATMRQSIDEARDIVKKSEDGAIFNPESHAVGVSLFEMAMRDIDSPLREILAVHQAIQEYYRDK